MRILYENYPSKTKLTVVFTGSPLKDAPYSKFEGKDSQIYMNNKTVYVGTKGVKDADGWRTLGFVLIRYLREQKAGSVVMTLPDKCRQFLEGMLLGDYVFDKYKSEVKPITLKKIVISGSAEVAECLVTAKVYTEAQKMVRDWVNTSPEDAHSETIEEAVRESFEFTDVEVEVFGQNELANMEMNGHLAVNRASRHEAKTIRLTYNPPTANKHIVLIGKGLTYDSGGLSIKPGTSMTTMKADKAGAMTVWGIVKAVEELGLDVKVTAYMCIAENMIDGSAYKPDDIITMKNGKTVHVKNTDAEGRIVLFDNICLAQELDAHADEYYTLATLTGAAVYQFGDEACGMVGFNDNMKKVIKKFGDKAGEVFMDAAFHKYMMDGVDDSIADLSNTGTSNMGCQKAGLFLTNALKKKNKQKYLHLDIAGPAFVEKGFGVNGPGGTGFAVRTFLEYLTKIGT